MQGAKQTIPHFYLSVDLPLEGLQSARASLNEEQGEQRVSVNDLIIWFIAQALIEVPEVNVQCTNDDRILQFAHADIAVGVATDRGLITPVVRAADTKPPRQIATEMAELSSKARAGKLSMDEISGGTFTLSNLGMMGVKEFTAIINPPQGAILAAGKSEQRVVVEGGRDARCRAHDSDAVLRSSRDRRRGRCQIPSVANASCPAIGLKCHVTAENLLH